MLVAVEPAASGGIASRPASRARPTADYVTGATAAFLEIPLLGPDVPPQGRPARISASSGDRAADVSVLAAEREGPMIQPQSGSTGIRPVHAFVVVGTLVVAAVVAFAALHFIVGLLWFFVKLVVVLALVYFVARMVLRHARR